MMMMLMLEREVVRVLQWQLAGCYLTPATNSTTGSENFPHSHIIPTLSVFIISTMISKLTKLALSFLTCLYLAWKLPSWEASLHIISINSIKTRVFRRNKFDNLFILTATNIIIIQACNTWNTNGTGYSVGYTTCDCGFSYNTLWDFTPVLSKYT